MSARTLLAVSATAALTAVTAAAIAADAQPFPNRPIRMVVPVSAGSQTDIAARMIGQKLYEAWGQQVVVDNRPSAGGTIAGGIVASAPPDGHTMILHSISHAVNATLYPKLPYDTLRDFAGVTQVASVPNVLVVGPGSGIKSVKELIALAKSKPGQMNYGSAGIGTGTHLNGEQFKLAVGIDVVHVPFRGTPEALTDTATGRINYFFSPIVPALPFVRDKRLVALGVTTLTRSSVLPDVPTVAEAGVPGFEFDLWIGILAPAKTPRPILTKMSVEVGRVLAMPDIRERMLSQGTTPKPTTPEEFDRFVRAEVERVGKIVRASGARAD
jgi:tripartite-type tricarboxylate transporter receptor subunit TctC